MRAPLVCSILLFSLAVARADEQVRSTQEELRRRNVYFGDVDGRETPELQEALKRYQKRKGFSASGDKDPDTLRSLGVLARQPGEAPPKELNWPEEPVLRSDAKIDVGREAVRVSQESGVSIESLMPAIAEKGPAGQRSRARRVAAAQSQSRRNGGSGAGAAAAANAPAPANGAGRERHGRQTDQQLEPRELQAFIAGYLAAAGGKDLGNELRFYADRVDYFQNGTIDRRIIERSLRDYYTRWSRRAYRLSSVVSFQRLPARGEIVVVCRVDFTLKQNGRKIKGQTENRIVINAATADPRIVRVEERRVRG